MPTNTMATILTARKTRRWPELSRGRFAGLPRLRVFLVRHRHDLPGFRCGYYIARNAAAGAVARDLVVWVQHRDSGAHHQYGFEFPLSHRVRNVPETGPVHQSVSKADCSRSVNIGGVKNPILPERSTGIGDARNKRQFREGPQKNSSARSQDTRHSNAPPRS